MFAEPTLADFLELIDWHIGQALKSLHRGVNRVRSEFSAAQAFHSSRRIIFSVEAARKEFDAGVEAVLGELMRTIRNGLHEDTELGVLMELEVGHGETEVYAGVQA